MNFKFIKQSEINLKPGKLGIFQIIENRRFSR